MATLGRDLGNTSLDYDPGIGKNRCGRTEALNYDEHGRNQPILQTPS